MKVNQLKASVVLSYSSMILGYAIAIVYTPIMLRLLGQSEYGLYNLVSSVVSYLGLMSFGFGSAFIRYYSRYKINNQQSKISMLNGMFLIVFIVIGFIALIAGLIVVMNIEYIFGEKLTMNELATAKILMTIMIFNIVISLMTSVFNNYVVANEEYIFQKIIGMIKLVLGPLIILPVLLMGYKSVGMILATSVISLIFEISQVIFCLKKLKMKFLFQEFDFSLMREMSIFSFYIFMNMIIDLVNWNVDKFILGIFHGTVTVAIYGLAVQLNFYYLSISLAISSVFIPKVNRMVAVSNDNKELTLLFTKVGRVQFLILSLISSGLILFGLPFINLWAGKEYSESYLILIILIVPVTIPLIQNLGIEIQRAKNMHQFRSWIYLFIAICNLCMSIPLGKLYGGIGCAVGTAVSFIIGNGIIMNWYNHKKVGLNMKFFWRQILSMIPSLIPPIASGILMLIFLDLNHIITFFICGTIYVIIFGVSMWFLGMNKYEKDLLAKPTLNLLSNLRLCKTDI
ncbi:MAG: Polysaccharide biosynthesis protein [Firmicutes bacterium]|nr:Polysaccharide biosynthesis protein [Bacillota bacterium]